MPGARRGGLVTVVLAAFVGTGILTGVAGSSAAAAKPGGTRPSTAGPSRHGGLSIRVEGNHLVDRSGHTVVLRGADTSGTEYACVSEHTIFDGDQEASPASIAAMRSWGFDAARVELNESCWLGVQGVSPSVSGPAYRKAIENYVDALQAAGMYVIVDMHFSSTGGDHKVTGQEPMPDERYAPAFWSSVATAFKDDPAIIFDLFNEPYPNGNVDTPSAWQCVIEGSAGGTCTGFRYPAAGLQQLLDDVRATGATNVIMVGGPQYAGDLDRWEADAPVDPLHQLAASIHIYWKDPAHPDWSPCYAPSCWHQVLAVVARSVPIVVGEFGELDCGDSLYPPFLAFADRHGISYLGWAWFTGSCKGEPSLISSYDGTATPYGIGYRQHLAALGLGSDRPLGSPEPHRTGEPGPRPTTAGHP
jgi:endoglucanase